jgi:hypothetical protein
MREASRMTSRWGSELDGQDPLEELMSLHEAARLMGRSEETLRSAARRGTLEAVRLSGVWVTTRSAVAYYIATRRRRRYLEPR